MCGSFPFPFFLFVLELGRILKKVSFLFWKLGCWEFLFVLDIQNEVFFGKYQCPWPQWPPLFHPPCRSGGSGLNHWGGPLGGPLSCQMFLKDLPLQCSASMTPGCGKSSAGSFGAGMGNLIRNTGALGTLGGGRLGGGRRMLGNRGRNVGRGWFWGNSLTSPVRLPLTEFSDGGSTGSAVFKTKPEEMDKCDKLCASNLSPNVLLRLPEVMAPGTVPRRQGWPIRPNHSDTEINYTTTCFSDIVITFFYFFFFSPPASTCHNSVYPRKTRAIILSVY